MYGPPRDCKGKFGREDKSAQMYSAFGWRSSFLAMMSCARVFSAGFARRAFFEVPDVLRSVLIEDVKGRLRQSVYRFTLGVHDQNVFDDQARPVCRTEIAGPVLLLLG